jgi:hypothetical protein
MNRDILQQANYRYNYDRDMYINRDEKKGFSLEFVADSSEDAIRTSIAEVTDKARWKFYTNLLLTEGIQQELERVLG